MANWIMPHEMDEAVKEEVNPSTAKPRYILPHETEKAEAEKLSPESKVLKEETPAKRVLIGAGQAANDVRLGAKQFAGKVGNALPFGIASNTWDTDVSKQLAEERGIRTAIDEDPYSSSGKLGFNVAMGTLSPSARAFDMALTAAAMEGGLKPREEPTWGNIAADAGQAGALGFTIGPLASYLASAAGRTKNAFQGRFENPEHQNRYRIFKENDVPFSRGDISQDPTTVRLENAARRIPFTGRPDFLKTQADRLGRVIEDAPSRIAGSTPQQSKEDIGSVLVKSIQEKYASNKKTAGQLYDDVSARVQAAGNPPVPTTELARETQALLAKYPTVFSKLTDDPATVKTLEEIASGTSPKASKILGPNGQPIMTAPQLTFDELRTLDSDLGALIRQGRTMSSRGDMNNKTFGQLVKVQNALRKDIETWSTSVGDPEIATGIAEANKYFKENVVPFRSNQTVRKVIHGEEVNQDTLADKMFKLDSPWLSDQSISYLTPEGVQAGRFHLIKKAEERAVNDALQSGYSPSKFLRGTDLGETGGKLFSPTELGKLDDLQELVRSSNRAAGHSADPETGAGVLSFLPLMSLKIPMIAKGYSAVSQSEPWTRFMLADPRLYTGDAKIPLGPLERYVGTLSPGQMAEGVLRRVGEGVALEPKAALTASEDPKEE